MNTIVDNIETLENVGMIDNMSNDFENFKTSFGAWNSTAFIWSRWIRS